MLQGRVRAYEWGSLRAIPELFGKEAAEGPVAEVWLGAHPDDPASVGRVHSIFDESQLYPSRVAPRAVGPSLDEWVAQDPDLILGESVVERYGARLPYLLKLIAPAQPLSLQVHPSIAQAEEGYAAEEAAGVPHRDPRRNYKDRNHKPELVYALSTFQALAGFRARRRIGEVIEALGTPLTDDLRRVLRSRGVRGAFEFLLSEPTRPGADAVAERLAMLRLTRRGRACVVGVNIGKNKWVEAADAPADYAVCARKLARYADYLVVNVSSPNTPGLRDLQAVESLRSIVRATREAADLAAGRRVPILVKIAPDLGDADVDGVADLAVEEGMDGVVATNTTVAHSHGEGGLSGEPVRARALEVVSRLRRRLGPEYIVIGVGGIFTVSDAEAMVSAGADLLETLTGFVYEGPLMPGRINRALARR